MNEQEVNQYTNSAISELLENRLLTTIQCANLPITLENAVKYSVFPRGKRIRPKFLFSILSDLGVNTDLGLDAAVALELLHCASLIHDDLPALDNDDMRRGKPACHKQYRESTALLAGDAMPVLAINALQHLELVKIISKAYIDLCAGQELDLEEKTIIEDLFALFRLKTGALFGAAAQCAFSIRGANKEIQTAAYKFGESFGVLFQVIDDVQDHEHQEHSLALLNRAKEEFEHNFAVLATHCNKLGFTELTAVTNFVTEFISKTDIASLQNQ